jgi:glycosyltransferase involved in cell wall biosynthesis
MLWEVAKHLNRQRFSPHVMSLTTKGEIGKRLESEGIPVEALGMTPGQFSLWAFLHLMKRLKALHPDIVHTWMYHADFLGGLAARLAGIKTIAWGIHNADLPPGRTKRSTWWIMKACAWLSPWVPQKILCCSETAKAVHLRAGYSSQKFTVIPNGFDLQRFHPDPDARLSVRRELGLPEETPLVGLIGRYDPRKNHQGFFQAAAHIHKQRPDIHFLLAGDSITTDNTSLARFITSANCENVTHLLGLRNDIPRLMAALDVLASSSSEEAFPLVLGEAMASGVPCVGTAVGDSADIIGDTGHTVPRGDMDDLAQKILTLLSLSPEKRQALGENARTRIQNNFAINTIATRYETFYGS